ncbi:MAG: hypothetical protein ACKVOP_06350, partial [Sphingomonadaceae bacterium]
MMIAQRFRAVGYLAMVAIAATILYLISLQVAAERGKLEAVERQIVAAQREMRQLQTELGTRASMRQLEKWNGDVLALSAPKADQYVHGQTQLAALTLEERTGEASPPPPAMAAAVVTKPQAPAVRDANFVRPAVAADPILPGTGRWPEGSEGSLVARRSVAAVR